MPRFVDQVEFGFGWDMTFDSGRQDTRSGSLLVVATNMEHEHLLTFLVSRYISFKKIQPSVEDSEI